MKNVRKEVKKDRSIHFDWVGLNISETPSTALRNIYESGRPLYGLYTRNEGRQSWWISGWERQCMLSKTFRLGLLGHVTFKKLTAVQPWVSLEIVVKGNWQRNTQIQAWSTILTIRGYLWFLSSSSRWRLPNVFSASWGRCCLREGRKPLLQ